MLTCQLSHPPLSRHGCPPMMCPSGGHGYGCRSATRLRVRVSDTMATGVVVGRPSSLFLRPTSAINQGLKTCSSSFYRSRRGGGSGGGGSRHHGVGLVRFGSQSPMLTLRSCLFASANDDAPPHSASRAVITPSLFSLVVWFARYLEPWNVMLAMRKEYPDEDILKIDLIFETFYFLMTPDAAREVLLEKSTDFPLRYSIDLFETLELDRGIVYAQGDRHRTNKRACVPAFESASSMSTFVEAIRDEVDDMCDRWVAKIGNKASAQLDVYDEVRQLTLAVVLRVTFGLRSGGSGDKLSNEISTTIAQYLEAIVACANEPIVSIAPQLSSNYRRVVGSGGLLEKLRRLVLELIAERRRVDGVVPTSTVEGGAPPSGDLLGVLLATGASDEDILLILFDLIIAGSDTTASTISASLLLASKDERLVSRVREEPDALSVAHEDVRARLPVSTAIARETLRLYPPVPFVGRRSVRPSDVCGYSLDEGVVCCWSPFYFGRQFFSSSVDDAWDPARVWLDGGAGGTTVDPFAWLPFGAGVRGCLGTRLGLTESVLAVGCMLQRFDFTFERDELTYKYDLTLNLSENRATACEVRKI
ncbi:hypothetical protein PPROV_000064000 [Pycnococcus provasolii]|uniref:Cytochrome P450 n=1 Tax=Pycnococcus provasolii TaxID=41880 RepID=A0A830H6H9_9CHLO|nr:hypothetical protein PPROV_000064000 [Pycnococcus provasolii]